MGLVIVRNLILNGGAHEFAQRGLLGGRAGHHGKNSENYGQAAREPRTAGTL
jgi:hypothetical protein